MAVTNFAKKHLLCGGFDLVNDTIKVAILNSNHVTDIDAQEYFDDVNTNEVSGTGYTAGGKELTGKAVNVDNTNNLAKFTASNVTWDNVTFTNGRYACIYKSTGDASTSPILCIKDFGINKSPAGTDFKIVWSPDGIFRIKIV